MGEQRQKSQKPHKLACDNEQQQQETRRYWLRNRTFCTHQQNLQERQQLQAAMATGTDITKCKMPARNPLNPELWFTLVDLQFAMIKPKNSDRG